MSEDTRVRVQRCANQGFPTAKRILWFLVTPPLPGVLCDGEEAFGLEYLCSSILSSAAS